jgi:lipopolysaccharide/colanic/teichoic acid biosynthesis glycosyltransferase
MAHISDIDAGHAASGYVDHHTAEAGTSITRPPRGFSWRLKGVLDFFGALALLIAFAPLLLVLALLVKFTSPGPVFFRQPRYGAGKQMVIVTKFRTMRVEGTDMSGLRQTTRDDDRITPLGRFLRRSCMDELPQLWDVVCGRLSLVGPRPHARVMEIEGQPIEGMIPQYHLRHQVRPGVTGLAQVNGNRGPLHTREMARERIAYDMLYIRKHSIWLDIKILLRTLAVPFQKDGSY